MPSIFLTFEYKIRLPAGFYYKTFMAPRHAWKYLFEPFIRQSAGLGKAPEEGDGDRYEHFYMFTDVLVVGGGIAGLQAALSAARTGVRVLLLEQTADWGGRAVVAAGGVSVAPFCRRACGASIARRWGAAPPRAAACVSVAPA